MKFIGDCASRFVCGTDFFIVCWALRSANLIFDALEMLNCGIMIRAVVAVGTLKSHWRQMTLRILF